MNDHKFLLLVIDGLGDRPIKELGNKTPLEAADTPVLDKLAEMGIAGQLHTIGRGITPGIQVWHPHGRRGSG